MSTSSKGTWQKLFTGRHTHDQPELSPSTPSSSSSTSAIRAYLRLRPASAALQAKGVPQTSNIDVISRHEVVAAPSAFLASDTSTHSLVSSATRSSLSGRPSTNDAEVYTFTEVLPEDTDQASLYNATARPLIENSLGAGPSKSMSDSLILAYGVSGGGKTYTVQGSDAEPGLLPRTLATILRSVSNKQSNAWVRPARLTGIEVIPQSERFVDARWKQQKGKGAAPNEEVIDLPEQYEYAVWCSFVEVYNENIHDLLAGDLKPKNLTLKQDHKHSDNKFVSGATNIRLWSEQHATEILEKGLLTRHRSATRQNETSSRSHSIFTIQVLRFPIGADATSPSTAIHMSRLSVVDLAGSERARNTHTNGDRLKEAGKINQSLMILGRCFEVIRANDAAISRGKQPVPVPFRHSKLTEVLKPFFCGSGEIVMVAAMDPYRTAIDENINVLRFTSLARQIKTNYSLPPSPSILTPSNEVPHYSLPTRSGRLPLGPTIAKPIERATRHASSSSTAEPVEVEAADESLVSFVNENAVDDDEINEVEDEDPLVSELFEEIRQLRQEAVQKDLEVELAMHRIRQEERDRYNAKVDEVRQQMAKEAQFQKELMEDLMDRKIDNMKVSYDRMVGLLQEQLRLATADKAGDGSVNLDSSLETAAEEQAQEGQSGAVEDVEESVLSSPARSPLAATPLSSVQQQSTTVADSTKDLGRSTNTRKSQRVASRTSEAAESICVETVNMLKSSGTAKRQSHKSGSKNIDVLARLDDY